MKSVADSIQFAVALLAAASFVMPAAKPDPLLIQALSERNQWAGHATHWANEYAKSANELQRAKIANGSCNCSSEWGKSCTCEVCTCTPIASHEPLTDQLAVGLPPDVVHLTSRVENDASLNSLKPVPIALVEPQKLDPPPKPAVKAAAPTGHWQITYGRRGRTYQQWVWDTPARSGQQCSSGGCAAPGQQLYYSTGGGCASCGRGRR